MGSVARVRVGVRVGVGARSTHHDRHHDLVEEASEIGRHAAARVAHNARLDQVAAVHEPEAVVDLHAQVRVRARLALRLRLRVRIGVRVRVRARARVSWDACTPKMTYMSPIATPLAEPPVKARVTPFLKMASTWSGSRWE